MKFIELFVVSFIKFSTLQFLDFISNLISKIFFFFFFFLWFPLSSILHCNFSIHRAIVEVAFEKHSELDQILKFSSPKVLRLVEVLRQVRPLNFVDPRKRREKNEAIEGKRDPSDPEDKEAEQLVTPVETTPAEEDAPESNHKEEHSEDPTSSSGGSDSTAGDEKDCTPPSDSSLSEPSGSAEDSALEQENDKNAEVPSCDSIRNCVDSSESVLKLGSECDSDPLSEGGSDHVSSGACDGKVSDTEDSERAEGGDNVAVCCCNASSKSLDVEDISSDTFSKERHILPRCGQCELVQINRSDTCFHQSCDVGKQCKRADEGQEKPASSALGDNLSRLSLKDSNRCCSEGCDTVEEESRSCDLQNDDGSVGGDILSAKGGKKECSSSVSLENERASLVNGVAESGDESEYESVNSGEAVSEMVNGYHNSGDDSEDSETECDRPLVNGSPNRSNKSCESVQKTCSEEKPCFNEASDNEASAHPDTTSKNGHAESNDSVSAVAAVNGSASEEESLEGKDLRDESEEQSLSQDGGEETVISNDCESKASAAAPAVSTEAAAMADTLALLLPASHKGRRRRDEVKEKVKVHNPDDPDSVCGLIFVHHRNIAKIIYRLLKVCPS